jgi:hypothetical protein
MKSMDRVRFCGICLLLLYLCGASVMAESRAVELNLEAVKSELVSGFVARVDIFYMSYDRVTRTRITPAMLEVQADAKFRLDLPSPVADDLVRAIEGTKLHRIDDEPDLRWGAVFFNRDGKRVHSIYLNGRSFWEAGRKGYVDGTAFGLNGALVAWFEKHFLKR